MLKPFTYEIEETLNLPSGLAGHGRLFSDEIYIPMVFTANQNVNSPVLSFIIPLVFILLVFIPLVLTPGPANSNFQTSRGDKAAEAQ
jgi:hypothetical protein